MSNSDLAIDAHGLRKLFGQKTAVADLTLQVKRGEVFGFLGPNGAGKTTALKMMLGLTKPSAGSGELLGRPLGDRKTRGKIGFLPEHFRFHDWLRAGEFLDLHGRLYGMKRPKRESVIPDLLELVGLGDQAGNKLSTFSKGMLQRVGVAQSLLNDPELVFLDEPTSGLDPIGRRMIRDIIDGLRQEGTTVFLNSHLLSEVEKSCDKVAFIRDGFILQTISLKEFEAGNIRLLLRVGQPTRELLDGLRKREVGALVQEPDGRIRMTLSHEAQIPEIAEWLIQQGHSIHELTPQRLSLEDRFMNIVGENQR